MVEVLKYDHFVQNKKKITEKNNSHILTQMCSCSEMTKRAFFIKDTLDVKWETSLNHTSSIVCMYAKTEDSLIIDSHL